MPYSNQDFRHHFLLTAVVVLGRYDRKVILSQVALVTSDVEQANLVAGAIQTAIQQAQREPMREIRRIPVAF